MPYIKQEKRDRVWGDVSSSDPGELNYLLTKVIHGYIYDHGLNYDAINDVVGALEGCKLEFYRRIVAPYEDRKIEENGDV